jgi:peptidoglycan biosynthesis protein MviN/MurJ (putative lipid II flippase)
MKNARFSLWLAAAFLAGGVATWLLTVPAAWAKGDRQYQCFDIKRISQPLGYTLTIEYAGWELVTADAGIYCMRRPR